MSKPGIKYYSFLESSGYGLAALAYIDALLELQCSIHWVPLVLGERGYQPWYQLPSGKRGVEKALQECISDHELANKLTTCLESIDEYQSIVMHVVPEYWPYMREPGKHNIGYTVWETTRLPGHFSALINQVDRVLVPSVFNKPVFEDSGVKIPIRVVPHILNAPIIPPDAIADGLQRLASIPPENFVFYSINTWTARKDMWTLVRTYLESFTIEDNVSLIIKTSLKGPSTSTDLMEHDTRSLVDRIVVQYPEAAHIKVISHKISNPEITALHQRGDCFVSTSHSEGWGLGMFEAAGAGNPIIAIGWGGHMDFLRKDSSYLASYELTEVIDTRGETSYSRDQKWAKANPEELVGLFKKVFAEPEVARQKGQALAGHLHQTFNKAVVGKQLYQAIHGK